MLGTSSGSQRFPKEALAEVLPARTHYRLELPDSIWNVWQNISGLFSNKINIQNSGKGTKASRATVPSKMKESEGSISDCKRFHKTILREGRGSKVW